MGTEMERMMSTNEFKSVVFKPLHEIFICYGQEDYYHNDNNADGLWPDERVYQHREETRSKRTPYIAGMNPNENQKEVHRLRCERLKKHVFFVPRTASPVKEPRNNSRAGKYSPRQVKEVDLSGMKKEFDEMDEEEIEVEEANTKKNAR